jgi:short-subunit dehydrogenase
MSESTWTVMVTGASSGLGAEFVRQLAPRCGRIIAVARRASRLQALADDPALTGSVEIVPLVADLATLEGQARAVECIRQQGPLDLLVNNAGVGSFGPFHASDVDAALAMQRLHQDALLLLTRAALPAMRERRRGHIVNVASVGAFLPMPGSAVYAATKAFMHSFSVSLSEELKRDGVRVQSLCPGFTHTEIHAGAAMQGFDKSRTPAELWMDARDVVAQSLAALDDGPVLLVPGAANRRMGNGALEQALALLAEQTDQE